MPLKTGTNQTDRKAIAEYLEAGEESAKKIAIALKLPEQAVANCIKALKKPKKKPAAKRKPKQVDASQEDAGTEDSGTEGVDFGEEESSSETPS